ncbi:unnamed protein product [Cladocopium goreaui]|uniref:ABC1 atypical kinase-like domain-containing protein n=1 Tax=Cladocopium goreaui TaxID=2562237 RepID=A0A9P1GQ92_9DINO|nr:unnamed protein product [Cladocopium goreaui]
MAVRDTIEIIDGVHSGTTRLSLKTQLERFGDIDICHKIGDPREEHPGIIWNPHCKLPDREAFCFPEL